MKSGLLLCLISSALAHDIHAQELIVSGFTSSTIHRFDSSSGTALGDYGNIPGAQSARFGPDSLLYVVSETTHRILRYRGNVFVDEFVVDDPGTPEDETGGLNGPTSAVFGPDQNLYVGSFETDSVLRYDGMTGAFMGTFVATGQAGLDGPDAGMVFGPDGHLYVPSFHSDQVLRYDGESGATIDAFIDTGEGNLNAPRMLRFRSDGVVFVTSWANNRLLRFDSSGQFIDQFFRSTRPTGFAFGPNDGDVYVTSDNLDWVQVYDGTSGVLIRTLVPSGGGGLIGGTYVEFSPDPELRLSRLDPGSSSAFNSIHLRGASPDETLLLLIGTNGASMPLGPCRKKWIGVENPIIYQVRSNSAGEIDIGGVLSAQYAGQRLLIQFVELTTCRVSNLVDQTIR